MTPPDRSIWHVAEPADWHAALHSGHYRCDSLQREGFIHACGDTQLAGVLQRYYPQRHDITLLVIDTDALTAPPVMENTVGGNELFPHVYGAIPVTAVTAVLGIDDRRVRALIDPLPGKPSAP